MRLRLPIPPDAHRSRRLPLVLAGFLIVLAAGSTVRAAGHSARDTSSRAAWWMSAYERTKAPRDPAPEAAPQRMAAKPRGETAGDGTWSHLGISSLEGHVAVFDAARDRMLVFGGDDNGYKSSAVWALSMHDAHPWRKLEPAGEAPSSRALATGIYDPVRDRLVIFGGFAGGASQEVWALSLSGTPAWTQLSPAGTPPSGFARMVYDSVHDRALLYDGSRGVWALSLSGTPSWSELSAGGTGPTSRAWPTVIYDPSRDRMIVFSGDDDNWPLPTDVWALSLSGTPTWTEVPATGTRPEGRVGATAVYDAARDRMIFYGGSNYFANMSDAWALSFSGAVEWTPLEPAGDSPHGRSFHTAVYDGQRARMVVFAGAQFRHGPPDPPDLWALSLAGAPAWSPVRGTVPSPRYGHSAVYDPADGRMLIFGGFTEWGGPTTEVWACTLDDRPTWTNLQPAGTPPPARSDAVAVFDHPHDRMIVFSPSADAWELSLRGSPRWSVLDTRGARPANVRSAVVETRGHRIIVLSGPDNEVWSLSLSNRPKWTRVNAIAHEPVSTRATAVYDSKRDRLLLPGEPGSDGVWELPLHGTARWNRLPVGPSPDFHLDAKLVYDERGDRVVMFDGQSADRLWALSLSGTPAWRRLAPGGGQGPFGEDGHSAIYDPEGNRMVVFGGQYFYNALNDAWVLTWGNDTPASRPAAATGNAVLQACYPNPFNPRVTIPFELREDGAITLIIYDVSGRIVKTLVSGWTARGAHTATWEGASDAGQPVSSGIYFCRLQAGNVVATQKVVLLK